MCTVFGIGYGPLVRLVRVVERRRASAASSSRRRRTGCRSGRRPRGRSRSRGAGPVESPIDAISCAEFAATGSESTRWFHALLAGKIGQRGRAAGAAARARTRRPDEQQRRRASGDERPASRLRSARTAGRILARARGQRHRHAACPRPRGSRGRSCRRAARRARARSRARARCPGSPARVAVDARKKREKTWPCSSAGMPMPVSATTSRAESPFAATVTVTDAAVVRELHRVRDEVVEHLREPVARRRALGG